jgi:hypothetical protein
MALMALAAQMESGDADPHSKLVRAVLWKLVGPWQCWEQDWPRSRATAHFERCRGCAVAAVSFLLLCLHDYRVDLRANPLHCSRIDSAGLEGDSAADAAMGAESLRCCPVSKSCPPSSSSHSVASPAASLAQKSPRVRCLLLYVVLIHGALCL